MQINPRAGLTFATALRSILRSDPDVVMVGEIRDGETAQDLDRGRADRPLRALDAAHERRAGRAHAPERDGRRAVPDRRRPSRPCSRSGSRASSARTARELVRADGDELVEGARLDRRSRPPPTGSSLYRKRGCPRCGQTGYSGRVGIFQLLRDERELEQLAAAKATRDEIERAAIASGMRTLWDDGIDKVAAGLTSVEELARVTV